MSTTGERWTSRGGFILATIGSAVGIGSIWKFPYEVGANGGGAFVLVYLLGLALVVVPLMFAEFALGRRGGADAASSIAAVAAAQRASPRWLWVGLAGALTCFLVLSFYSVIGGWTLAYALDTALRGLPEGDPAAVRARYDAMLASPWRMLLFHAVFMTTAVVIVMRGVQRGIENASKVLMPLLVALMFGLAAYSVVEGDTASALRFLFYPDFAHFDTRAALEALGLGFFSIGVGLGLMITYAAYSDAAVDLKQVAIYSVVADSAISLIAGLAVFPVVFAHGLDPAGGPGLVFVSLPLAFAHMPFAQVAACAFFVLLFVAALASAISLLEGVVAVLVFRWRLSRRLAALAAGGACFCCGIATVLSFNHWAHWHPLGALPLFEDFTVFDLIDHVTSNLMLPLGGLVLALFVGWVVSERLLAEELRLGAAGAHGLRMLLRYLVPVAIAFATFAPLVGAAR